MGACDDPRGRTRIPYRFREQNDRASIWTAAYIVHCVFKVPYKAARVGRLSGRVFHEGRNCRRQEVWNAGCVKRVPLGEGEGLVPWSLDVLKSLE